MEFRLVVIIIDPVVDIGILVALYFLFRSLLIKYLPKNEIIHPKDLMTPVVVVNLLLITNFCVQYLISMYLAILFCSDHEAALPIACLLLSLKAYKRSINIHERTQGIDKWISYSVIAIVLVNFSGLYYHLSCIFSPDPDVYMKYLSRIPDTITWINQIKPEEIIVSIVLLAVAFAHKKYIRHVWIIWSLALFLLFTTLMDLYIKVTYIL